MSFAHQRDKLMKKLTEWPDARRHELAPGMGMTWWELAKLMVNSKKISRVKKLVRKAEEVGIIDGGD